jgi:hypothetical protein
MTPLQAAKSHCANYQPDGSCLGVYYNDDLSVDSSRYRPCDRCLLADHKRCEYFEEIIVPMRMSRETAEAKAQADKKEAAVNTYLKLHKLIPTKTEAKRMCLQCRRVEVEGIARFCGKCALVRKRESDRRHARTKRQSSVGKSENSPIGVEALTKAETSGHYDDPQTSSSGCSFSSTRHRTAQAVSETQESLKGKEPIVS